MIIRANACCGRHEKLRALLSAMWGGVAIAILSLTMAPGLTAQANPLRSDSLRLRNMRIRAHATNACKVKVSTSSSMNIDTDISPANVRRGFEPAARPEIGR